MGYLKKYERGAGILTN